MAIDSTDLWNELAEAALEHVDVIMGKSFLFPCLQNNVLFFTAIRAYQQVKNASMIYALHQIKV